MAFPITGSFPDCSGDVAPWMYLDFLADWEAKYSWGSAGLAYLYRQLDDAGKPARGHAWADVFDASRFGCGSVCRLDALKKWMHRMSG